MDNNRKECINILKYFSPNLMHIFWFLRHNFSVQFCHPTYFTYQRCGQKHHFIFVNGSNEANDVIFTRECYTFQETQENFKSLLGQLQPQTTVPGLLLLMQKVLLAANGFHKATARWEGGLIGKREGGRGIYVVLEEKQGMHGNYRNGRTICCSFT